MKRSMEPFLLPGTVILVDGRTVNARFMRYNFQQNWVYEYFEEYDILFYAESIH
mgnify:CR=1 FL=1